MSGIIAGISEFYREMAAPTRGRAYADGTATKTILPLKRIDFLGGTGIAIFLLVHKITLSVFLSIGLIATVGCHRDIKDSFFKNVQEAVKYAGALPIGFLGALFPQITNQKILEIPSDGLIIFI
jgi:hypothetical protein